MKNKVTFEEIKHINEIGQEYWSARELFTVLDYIKWDKFLNVIEKATQACKNSGQEPDDHFLRVEKLVEIGSGAKDIHSKKGLKKSQNILDHMGSTELAANLFRATQTEEKLKREKIKGKKKANQTHFEVGKKVRQTIKELGGTMPEDLSKEESIKKIASEKKKRLDTGKNK
jgi:predicted HNH restriction endonuclease